MHIESEEREGDRKGEREAQGESGISRMSNNHNIHAVKDNPRGMEWLKHGVALQHALW